MHGWNCTERDYDRMQTNHGLLWAWVNAWLESVRPDSVLEIGGGDGRLSELLDEGTEYQNVDLNAGAVDPRAIRADWLTLDKAPLAGRYDAVISPATINHVRDGAAFLDGIAEIRPRRAVVSFWIPLAEGFGVEVLEERKEGRGPGGGDGYYIRVRYGRGYVTQWAQSRGVRFEIGRVAKDNVLLLEFNQ